MDRRNQLGTALVVLAAVLFIVPAFFPVQPMLLHDTRDAAVGPPSELESDGYEIVAYENLTDRGQELYVKTLENDGEYRVPQGTGASDFDYLTDEERRQAYENDNRSATRPLVIERPEDDNALPPADEPAEAARNRAEDDDNNETDDGQTAGERRRQIVLRYDAIETSTEQPPLGSIEQLSRLLAALLAVVSLGVGGYLLSSK